jgi:hypothetical protein
LAAAERRLFETEVKYTNSSSNDRSKMVRNDDGTPMFVQGVMVSGFRSDPTARSEGHHVDQHRRMPFPHEVGDGESLMRLADAVMYAQKRPGGGARLVS